MGSHYVKHWDSESGQPLIPRREPRFPQFDLPLRIVPWVACWTSGADGQAVRVMNLAEATVMDIVGIEIVQDHPDGERRIACMGTGGLEAMRVAGTDQVSLSLVAALAPPRVLGKDT